MYGIRFEDREGTPISYTEDGSLAQVRLDGPVVSESPDDIEVRRERGYQKVEKREHRYREQAIKNEGLAEVMRLLIESQANAAKRDAQTVKMVKLFTKGQKQLLKQQNALFAQAATMNPPPPQDNWPSAAKGIVDSIGKVISTAVGAYSEDRRPEADRVLDAVSKIAALTAGLPQSAPVNPPTSDPRASAAVTSPVEAPGQPEKPTAPLAPELPTPAKSTEPQKPEPPAQPPMAGDPPKGIATAPAPQSRTTADNPAAVPAAQSRIAQHGTSSQPEKWRGGPSPVQVAWREMKRRIVSLSDSRIAQVVSSRQSFLEWVRWIAEPSEFLSPGVA